MISKLPGPERHTHTPILNIEEWDLKCSDTYKGAIDDGLSFKWALRMVLAELKETWEANGELAMQGLSEQEFMEQLLDDGCITMVQYPERGENPSGPVNISRGDVEPLAVKGLQGGAVGGPVVRVGTLQGGSNPQERVGGLWDP